VARGDLLLDLVRAGTSGDVVAFRRTVQELVADERSKHHHVLAERIEELARANGRAVSSLEAPVSGKPSLSAMLHEVRPKRRLDEMLLPPGLLQTMFGLIEEQSRADVLRSSGLEPRHRILLTGQPGTGKTTLAEALAEALLIPMYVVRYEGLIASYLGETASRLHQLFEFVSARHCVLFFDEFDAIGKERGDEHETGEIKRVVNSLLLQMDALPSYVVVVGASNHPELLDRAAWRRFQVRLELPMPSEAALVKLFQMLEVRFAAHDLPVGPLARGLKGASFAEAEEVALDVQRTRILHPEQPLETITNDSLSRWLHRATAESR
jgi:hypothetical protein